MSIFEGRATLRESAAMQPRIERLHEGDATGNAEPSTGDPAYDRLAARFHARFRACRSRRARDLWSALELAATELAIEGHIAERDVHRLRACACRDLGHIASALVRGTRDEVAAIAGLTRHPGALAELVGALHLSGDAIYRLAGEAGRAELRRAGEATCAGTLQCRDCGHARRLFHTTVVAASSDCGGTDFSKGFES
jgi:hypothetical protein